MRKLFAALILLGGVAGPYGATAMPVTEASHMDHRMGEFRETRPPIGYVQFCERHPEDCGPFSTPAARVALTPERWQELVGLNDEVNETIHPVTDIDKYGVTEWWTYPTERGDCEDYVLLKRKLLMERGWPANALLITVVRDEKGDGHAVLTARTSAGDLILDNQEPEIRYWHETPYTFLKRQSKTDPATWVSLRQLHDRPEVPVAGVEER